MSKIKKSTKRQRIQKYKINKNKVTHLLKKEQSKKTGINNLQIQNVLEKCPNFLGCFAQDDLRHLSITSNPSFLIVNFDSSYSYGTHWIALRIGKRTIEIFDPLGFNSLRWPNIPYFLLDFLHRCSLHRHIIVSPEIQPYNSTLCGFYCIYFVYFRSFQTFKECVNLFSKKLYKNDKILDHIFYKL